MSRCRLTWSIAICVLTFLASAAYADECANKTSHPEWIFCDDFEDNTAMVRQGRYFEYDNNAGDFVPLAGAGLNGSTGMRALWQQGEISAGGMKLAFGKNPASGMDKGIRSTENFREIYYRMYLKNQSGWTGSPAKLSRATIITGNDWSQAMIAHLWSDDSNTTLSVDPVRCVDPNENVICSGYNDFAHMTWLGLLAGSTPIFDSAYSNRWYCIEAHVKLNDAGQSNGIHEFWIDGKLEARRASLNFVNSFSAYGINAILFENFWNAGSVKQQERYFDNIVVSTQPIGCVNSAILQAPTNLRVVPQHDSVMH